jgi:hypothetical protein
MEEADQGHVGFLGETPPPHVSRYRPWRRRDLEAVVGLRFLGVADLCPFELGVSTKLQRKRQ